MATGEIVVIPCWFVWSRKMDSKWKCFADGARDWGKTESGERENRGLNLRDLQSSDSSQ